MWGFRENKELCCCHCHLPRITQVIFFYWTLGTGFFHSLVLLDRKLNTRWSGSVPTPGNSNASPKTKDSRGPGFTSKLRTYWLWQEQPIFNTELSEHSPPFPSVFPAWGRWSNTLGLRLENRARSLAEGSCWTMLFWVQPAPSRSVVFNSLRPCGPMHPPGPSCLWNFPGKNTGVVATSSSRRCFQPRDRTRVS